MGVKYRGEFDDINNVRFRIDIDEDGYSGAVNTFICGAAGFELRYEGDGARVGEEPIRGSECTIPFQVQNSTQESFLDSLAQSSELKYNVLIYRSGSLWWCGTVLPDLCQFENRAYPYEFALTAVDGLGRLDQFDFDYATNPANSDPFTYATIITECLNKTGLQDFFGASDVYLRCSVEFTESSQSTSHDRMEHIRMRREAVIKNWDKADNANEWEPLTCREVLEKLLRSLGARMEFSRGSYRIYQHQNYRGTSYTENRYSKTGITFAGYLSSATISPQTGSVWQSSDLKITAGGSYTYMPALRRAIVSARRRKAYRLSRETFSDGVTSINLGDINTTTPWKITGKVWIEATNAVSRLKVSVGRYNSGTATYDRAVVRADSSQAGRDKPYSEPGALSWLTLSPALSGLGQAAIGYQIPAAFTGAVDGRVQVDVDILLPVTLVNLGADIRVFVTAEAYGLEYVNGRPTATGTGTWAQIDWEGALLVEGMVDTTEQEWDDEYEWISNNTAQADNSVTVQLDDCLIDGNSQFTEAVEIYTGTAWQAATAWKRFSSDTATAIPLPALLASYILAHHWRPARVLRANFRDLPGFLFDNVNAPVNGSDVYVWNGGTFTANTARWDGEWIRYQFDAAAFSNTVKLPRNRDTVGTHDKDIKSLKNRTSDLGQVAGGTVGRWIDGYLNQANGKADIGTPSGGDIWRPSIQWGTSDGFEANIEPQYVFGVTVLNISTATTLDRFARRVFCNTNAAGFTVTLPPVSQFPEWEELVIVKVDGGHQLTIDADGTDLINGNGTEILTNNYEVCRLARYNNEWIILQ
jgi:hypothetical protein